MRLAILCDIHGNLPAFEAALEHLARQEVDQLVIAGDIVNGAPDSAACWQRARSLGCPILQGNHERYLFHFNDPEAPALWRTLQFAPVQWARAEFGPEELEEMRRLPRTLRLPEAPGLLLVHASARNDHDSIYPYTAEEQLAPMFAGEEAGLIVRGHNHLPFVRQWAGGLIATAGAVGLPLDGNPAAQYLIVEARRSGWHIAHQSVSYDLQAALRRFDESGYLEATGPMGQLFFREVATATHLVVPFLRAYHRWKQESPLTLSHAVDRFLTMGR
jgi:predicted phosphodiesterase